MTAVGTYKHRLGPEVYLRHAWNPPKLLGASIGQRLAVNPALEVVQACAKALDVSASYLVGADDEPTPKKKRSGPVSPLERKFQEVRKLPKKKQEFILQFLDNMLEGNPQKQKA